MINWTWRKNWNPFHPRFYMKYYETIPIVTITSLSMVWLGFSICKGFNRPDLKYTQKDTYDAQIDQLQNPYNPKLIIFNQCFYPKPEMYRAYQDMFKKQEEK